VTVEIAGHRLSIRTDAEEPYLRELARYVHGHIRDAQRGARGAVGADAIATLAALRIADDLFRERRDRVELERRVREQSKAILQELDTIAPGDVRDR
jgi:cell division protein ZapA (FtsZ GTPase activity inhibitor)